MPSISTREASAALSEQWGTRVSVPEAMLGTMMVARLPARAGTTQQQADRLRDQLLFEERIEVPLVALAGGIWARVSA